LEGGGPGNHLSRQVRNINKLRRATVWPTGTTEHFGELLRLQDGAVHNWIDLEFVAKHTRCIGWLIYYPFVLIAMLIMSRSTVFANYAPSLTIYIALGISLSIVFGSAVMLCWAARAAQETARETLTDGIIFAKGNCTKEIQVGGDATQPNLGERSRCAEQLETLLSRIDQLKDGAFSPFTQQPLVRAVLLPLGSFGWTALIENGMFSGL
jgi:hypothetical protein